MLLQWRMQALDKIRFESLTDKSKLDAQPELFIRLVPDKPSKTLSIIDSGVGMTKSGQYPILSFVYISCTHLAGGELLTQMLFKFHLKTS